LKRGYCKITYELIAGEVFCDFHFDNKIHGIGMGADYGKTLQKVKNRYEK